LREDTSEQQAEIYEEKETNKEKEYKDSVI
jgi:hypothetical protein